MVFEGSIVKNDIHAVIFDVDGTLYDYKTHSVLPSTVESLHRLKEQHIKIIVASGRSYALLGMDVIQLADPDYFVLANGHEILGQNGTPMRLIQLTASQTEKIERIASQQSIHMMLKYHSYSYIYSGWDEMVSVFGQTQLDLSRFRNCPTRDHHLQELPLGITLKGAEDLRDRLHGLDEELRVEYFYDPSECDVFLRGVNKWNGLCEVFRQTGIRPEQCIAFGDGGNDTDMLRAVGCGVAMGNACKEAKSAAKHICGPSWEDGIYRFLRDQAVL